MNNHGHTYLKIKFADSSVVKNSRERNAHLFFLLLLVFSKGGYLISIIIHLESHPPMSLKSPACFSHTESSG